MSIPVQDHATIITGGQHVSQANLFSLSPNVPTAQGVARPQPQRGGQTESVSPDPLHFAFQAAGERVDDGIVTTGNLVGNIAGTTGKYVAVGLMASMAMGRDGEEEERAATVWDDPSLDPEQQEPGMDGVVIDGQVSEQALDVGRAVEDLMERAFFAGEDMYGTPAGQDVAMADSGQLKTPDVPDARSPSEREKAGAVLSA